jgi:glycosyltransferase involved in cell wall biosynthesis
LTTSRTTADITSLDKMAKVAVITPTKNRRVMLAEAIASVRAQTCGDWEHWIVDDGSDDGTEELVRQLAAEDARVRFLKRNGDRCGANVCRNLAVHATSAEFIVFLDSDDLLEPDCLERRVQVMGRNADLDFATFQTSVFENTPGDLGRQLNPELLGDDLLRFLFFECPWIITGPVWRKASLLRLGLFDESLLSWQDVDLHIRAIAAGSRYLRFPEVDHHIRWQFESTKISIEQRRSPRHLEAASGILEKFERLVSEGPGMNWVRQRALCSLYFFVAERWIAAGSLSAALRSWRQIRRRPLGSRALHLSGAALLVIQALGAPGRRLGGRIAHKWKGCTRLRTNPELVTR